MPQYPLTTCRITTPYFRINAITFAFTNKIKYMISINPYLNFLGNTEAAMKFYKKVFGGEFIACRAVYRSART